MVYFYWEDNEPSLDPRNEISSLGSKCKIVPEATEAKPEQAKEPPTNDDVKVWNLMSNKPVKLANKI